MELKSSSSHSSNVLRESRSRLMSVLQERHSRLEEGVRRLLRLHQQFKEWNNAMVNCRKMSEVSGVWGFDNYHELHNNEIVVPHMQTMVDCRVQSDINDHTLTNSNLKEKIDKQKGMDKVLEENDKDKDNNNNNLPLPSVTYEWSETGVLSYRSPIRGTHHCVDADELKLALRFDSIASALLPDKLQLELKEVEKKRRPQEHHHSYDNDDANDDEGRLVFRKRQNVYYVRLQERIAGIDPTKDYILHVTSVKAREESRKQMIIHNKDYKPPREVIAEEEEVREEVDQVHVTQVEEPLYVQVDQVDGGQAGEEGAGEGATEVREKEVSDSNESVKNNDDKDTRKDEITVKELNNNSLDLSDEHEKQLNEPLTQSQLIQESDQSVNKTVNEDVDEVDDADSNEEVDDESLSLSSSVLRSSLLPRSLPLPRHIKYKWHRGYRKAHNGRYVRALLCRLELIFDSHTSEWLPRLIRVQCESSCVVGDDCHQEQIVNLGDSKRGLVDFCLDDRLMHRVRVLNKEDRARSMGDAAIQECHFFIPARNQEGTTTSLGKWTPIQDGFIYAQ